MTKHQSKGRTAENTRRKMLVQNKQGATKKLAIVKAAIDLRGLDR
jgi:hypothetical protein